MADEKKVYLDYNATTPLESEVIGAITNSLTEAWGNPSSSHDAGIKAKKVIDEARYNVANMIGAKSSDIIFTSGGTEGNNMIIQTAVKYAYHDLSNGYPGGDNRDKLPHFITSNLEHDSVKLVLEHLAEEGTASVTFVPASSKTGQVDVDDVLSAIRPSTCMITVMMANNETGVIQPIKLISEKLRQINQSRKSLPKILLHTDAAQAIGKIEVDVEDLGVDYLTVVGHKFYGPRIGAIYVRNLGNKDVPLYPMLYGGGQERNYRPGTENTVMIAGLGKEAFKDRIRVNGKFATSERLPNTCNVSILSDKLQGHKVLSNCRILQASIGAACHSQNRPSPILLAIGVPESVARNALRLSVGRETTKDDIDCVIQDLIQAVNQLENHTTET
ncbi:selenocysteine lyase-like isoform X1 [Mytilus trossulus]|uniref:selenocysteine lyase-like isoform X1 n=1 Tax=Mytilus trossulus TaxID=6551 RepID=UPI0030050C91